MTVLARLNLLWIRTRSRFVCRKRWKGAADRSQVAVDLGYSHIPERSAFLAGGLVKCQDLQNRFGNHRKTPTVLYLVSSALPHDADIQVRAARRAGGVVVVNQNGVAYPGWHGPGWERANESMRRIHGEADLVIYQSAFCRQGAERFLGERSGSCRVLHNPVDTGVFLPAPRPPADGPVLLLAGTHQFRYRVDAALDTLAALRDRLPGARLVIAGRQTWTEGARAEAHVRQRMEELRIADRVVLRGTYSQAEAPDLLRSAHMLLHTKFQDPCPRLVVEAMSCGLPVVYSATGGLPELVPARAGAGVPGPADYDRDHPPQGEALADAVCRVWADYDAYRAAARLHAEHNLDVRNWLDAHEDAFRLLLEAR